MAGKLITVLVVMVTLILMITGCQPLSGTSGGTSSTAAEGTRVGALAPDFQLQNLDGQTVSLSDLRGKTVLLNFWATWCSPCRVEMPYMQQIYEEWTSKGLILLAINVGESPSTARNFMQSNNLSFPVLPDSRNDIARKYEITAIPTTFFIDEDGIIRGVKIGPFRSKEEIEEGIRRVIP